MRKEEEEEDFLFFSTCTFDVHIFILFRIVLFVLDQALIVMMVVVSSEAPPLFSVSLSSSGCHEGGVRRSGSGERVWQVCGSKKKWVLKV